MSSPSRIAPIELTTSDGLRLEAEVVEPDGAPVAAMVVCHPHPLYGGSMHNNVVDRLVTDLPGHGVAVLRFNFRGTGRSEGEHGGGVDERADVVAAVDALAERAPDVPLVVSGYSFGADVALAVDDPRHAGWLAVSPPLRIVDPATMAAATDPRPTVIVSGTGDEYRPADDAAAVTVAWPTTTVHPAPAVGHFWLTGLDHVAAAAVDLLSRLGLSPETD